MHFFRVVLLSLTFLASTLTLAAEPRWYQVNVLIFSQNTIKERNPETWPTFPYIDYKGNTIRLNADLEEQPDQPLLTEEELALLEASGIEVELNDVEIATESGTDEVRPSDSHLPQAFVSLLPEEQYLTPYAEKLERDYRYDILFHETWNHPVLSEEQALPLEIAGGEDFGTIKELSGLVKIHISRYLHVETDLYLTEVVASDSPLSLMTGDASFDPAEEEQLLGDLESFGGLDLFTTDADSLISPVSEGSKDYFVSVNAAHMKIDRRMRSRELHYFDNPKFGMLVYFIPIEIQKPAETNEQ